MGHIVAVVPRGSGQLNEIIAFVKLKIRAFEIANWFDNKRRIINNSHIIFVTIKKINISFQFFIYKKIEMIFTHNQCQPSQPQQPSQCTRLSN